MNLFVANIERSVKEDALRSLFNEFGKVASVKIISDKFTGESKGFGFVEMMNDTEAESALVQLTNANFFGRSLVVSKARPKASRF